LVLFYSASVRINGSLEDCFRLNFKFLCRKLQTKLVATLKCLG
jgi:hypothetical protein